MSNRPYASARPSGEWSRPYLVAGAALIVVVIVVAYAPAVRGGFIWDDDAHVTKPELRSAHGLYRIWFEVGATQQYYPLLHSAFWLQHKLWGDSTIGYHLVNVAMHAGAAVLVLLIVRRLLMEKAVPWAEAGAFLTAAVFALHPVHVESVAWITELKNTLSAVFYLAALLAYLRFDRTRRRPMYWLATLLFVLALLTKPVTVTLPAALLVVFWWQRGRLSWRRDVLPLSLWFALGVASGLFAAWVEHDVLGAKGEGFSLLPAQRLLLPGRVVWFYLSKLAWPTELIFVYPRWSVDPAVWWQWLFPAGLIALLAGLLAFTRRSRAPLAALLFFIGSLFPFLGFFNAYLFIYTFVADHFQYLPSLGVIALVCGAAAAGIARVPWRPARVVLLLALPAVLGVLTFRQTRMYADIQTLYETTIQKNPACWMAHNNLGIVLKHENHLPEAIEHYRRALQLRPDYPEAYNNLAVVLNALGRHDDAVAAYDQALRLRPNYPDALGNLVAALTDAGRLQEAIDRGQQAIRLCPSDARLRLNLGVALGMAGRHPESVDQFAEAVRLRPDLSEAQANLAIAYAACGRFPEAIAVARRARDQARSPAQLAEVEKVNAWIESCRARLKPVGGGP